MRVPVELTLFADYHQIHLFDEDSTTDPGEAWTDRAVADQVAVDGDAMAVATAVNVEVSVTVEVLDAPPEDVSASFDHVVEAGLVVPSGHLVVMGCTDYAPAAARIAVPAGPARVRVARSNLEVASLLDVGSDEDPETMERVRLQIWSAASTGTVVLRRWPGRSS